MKQNKITAAVAVFASLLLIAGYMLCLPRHLFETPVSAVLESNDGRLMGARIAADGQWRFPKIDSVPNKFAKCITTYEDKRFYIHPGVDPLAVGRALLLNFKAEEIRSGASTISMQVIRLSRNGKKRTLAEKIIEAVLATRLEIRYSKDDILALYAANAPFGGNVVGLEAASWRYFGRSAEDLSWAESAMLAVLPNSPALIHPGKNRNALLTKRNFLLDRLYTTGIISEIECTLAKDELLPDKPYPMPDIAYHYLETLRKQNGDKLYLSTLDFALQVRTENILSNYIELFESNKVENIAAVVLDVSTGHVLAYCGNVDKKIPEVNSPTGNSGNGKGEEVDVVQAPRSSGSTLKPFLYAAMLDEGQILPTTLIPDIPFYYKDFSPHNYNHTFDGAVPAYSVIRRSLNVPSVKMLNDYGIDKFILLLQKIGFTTITRGANTYGLSLILGGAEIKLIDLATAYCGMAARLNSFADKAYSEKDYPLSAGAIWCTFEALLDVNRPEEESSWQSFRSAKKIAWKTGTSYGNRDAWSVGVTPQYVVAVWAGNCTGEGRPLLTGIGYAAPIMFDIFSSLPATSWFDTPEMNLEEVEVCPQSGHPVSDNCTVDNPPDTILAPTAPQRPEVCPYHKIIHLSQDEQYIVNSDCYSVSQMKTVSWFILPPAQEWYYMRTHSDYRQLPPLHPKFLNGGGVSGVESSPSSGASVIEIIYPQSGMRLAAPVALDSKSQGVIFSAAHSDPTATLFWHIDDQYICSTSNGEHKIRIIPTRGRHRLTIVDLNGNRATVIFFGE